MFAAEPAGAKCQKGAIGCIFRLGLQPAETAHDCKELRASAAPRLRPADPCGIEKMAGKGDF